ncbi:MAG: 16S rRNA (guanine(966)-N(2))-methyltransferase RsmD [Gemmatimonadota bacterium]
MRIIAGVWGGRRLQPLKGRHVRPTTDRVREAWMSAMGPSVQGAIVLDLFAGSGALGLETLSRGAASVTAVEQASSAVRVIEANVRALDAGDRHRTVRGDVFRFLQRLEEPVDLALADPPYGTGDAVRLVEDFLKRPFARELWLEHPVREALPVPDEARTRRYGDTAITTIVADS